MRRPPLHVMVGVVGVLFAAFVGVLWWSQGESSRSAAPVSTSANVQGDSFTPPSSPPVPGAAAPSFTVATLDHGSFALSAQRGKPTVLFFTASYCEPCIPQMRTLAQVHQEVGADQLSVLVLDVDPTEDLQDLRRLQRRTGGSYPFALDAGNRVTVQYRVRALDTKMFIDRDGVLVDRVDGIPESDRQLRDRVASLLKS